MAPVGRRSHEIGVRMAVGARRLDILAMVISQAAVVTLVGILLGLVGALGLTRFLQPLVFGVETTEPLTFAIVPVLLAGIALLAAVVPARRATRVDPVTVLSTE